MRSLLSVFKSIVLWVGFAFIPISLTWIFFGSTVAQFAFLGLGLLLLIDGAFSEKRILRVLRPRKIQIGETPAFTIEDPSSHIFVVHGLFSSYPKILVTRGALSLLAPEELSVLIKAMLRAGYSPELRFETVLTSWLIRVVSNLPNGFRDVLFFREKRTKTILVRESARGVFWSSILVLLESFYFGSQPKPLDVPEEIFRKLEAESRRCVPRLPVALSSHSAVSPWPDAFLTLGRSCIRPIPAVNLRA